MAEDGEWQSYRTGILVSFSRKNISEDGGLAIKINQKIEING
jgi:hypothetical protein